LEGVEGVIGLESEPWRLWGLLGAGFTVVKVIEGSPMFCPVDTQLVNIGQVKDIVVSSGENFGNSTSGRFPWKLRVFSKDNLGWCTLRSKRKTSQVRAESLNCLRRTDKFKRPAGDLKRESGCLHGAAREETRS
jgi:hypothetical protein